MGNVSMRNTIQITGLFLAITTSIVWAKDFRDVNWGDSYLTVLSAEPGAKGNGIDSLSLQTNIGDFPAILGYTFVDDRLVQAMYICSQCEPVLNELEKKYGQPARSGNYGRTRTASWDTDKSSITAGIDSSKMVILYISSEFSHLLAKKKELDSAKIQKDL